MYRKLLIANRGEIACRVARTAHRMGIDTVGIFSEADRYAMHAQAMDQSFMVGPPPSTESYLHFDHIMEIIQFTKA